MECEIKEEKEEKEEKKEKNEINIFEPDTKEIKNKLLKNRLKNNLLNLTAYLIYNRNNFEEKIQPNELELILETNSNISIYPNLIYKAKLKYDVFNPKRDLVANIPLYKQIPAEIEMGDEYYNKNTFELIVDITPEIKKGITLDISQFPFFYYEDEELKEINKNEIKSILECEKGIYNLCIYITDYRRQGGEQITIVENIIEMDTFFQFFKNIFVIIELYNHAKLNDFKNDEKLSQYLNTDNNDKKKVKILFNFLSSYTINKNNKNPINIFQENKKIFDTDTDIDLKNENMNYFFILDYNNKIVEIKPMAKLGAIITYVLLEFKRNKNNKDEINIFNKDENEDKTYIEEGLKLIYFIKNLKKLNLNYAFEISFNFSFTMYPNDELTKIELKKINQLKFNGTFFTKEYNYLKNIKEKLKYSSNDIILKELPTIDIDIDFNNMECQKCKEEINEDSYLYYCYICKIKYCYKCVQSQLKSEKKMDKYIDKKHHLLFFKTKDKNNFKEIELIKLGKNKFVESEEEDLISWRNTTCNGCRNRLSNNIQRYICLCCRKGKRIDGGYIDFCSTCIEKMCNNKTEKENLEKTANEVIDNFNDFLSEYKVNVEHKHDTHIYLMMPFQIDRNDGYDNY